MHRVGRTGRAGATGIGITFVEAEQARDVGRIAADLRLHGEFESAGLAPRRARTRAAPTTAAAAAASGARRRAPRASAGELAEASPSRIASTAGVLGDVVGDLLDLRVGQLALERGHAAAAVGPPVR